jgi:hypothetical protein
LARAVAKAGYDAKACCTTSFSVCAGAQTLSKVQLNAHKQRQNFRSVDMGEMRKICLQFV